MAEENGNEGFNPQGPPLTIKKAAAIQENLPSGFNINEFKSKVAQYGIARPNKFMVTFASPPGMSRFADLRRMVTQNVLSFHAEETNLPGAITVTSPVRRYGYGPIEEKPVSVAFTPTQIIFRGDADGLVWNYMHSWQRMAVNYENRNGMREATGLLPNQFVHELGYKKDYMANLTITTYTEDGQVSLRTVLREAYPKAVMNIPLSWSDQRHGGGDYMRIAVMFTFFDWHTYEAGPQVPQTDINVG